MAGMYNAMAPLVIEVYRLPLRDTVNEGGEDVVASSVEGEHVGDDGQTCTVTRSEDASDNTNTSDSGDAGQEGTAEVPPLRRNSASPSNNARRQVVLVTRPSARDIEQWTERATSIMVRSAGGSVRLMTSTQQSKQWVQDYKPIVSHSGWLIKRGHSIRNFKRRLFCIVGSELVYHDSHDATDVRGRIDLRKRTTVQCLLHSGFRLTQGSYQMILYAIDTHDRDVWIRKLQDHGVELQPTSPKTTRLIEQQRSNSIDKDPVLFSGWLRKRGRMVKSTKRRWFELTQTTLSYYSHPEGGTKKGSIELADAHVSHLDTLKSGERFSFVIRTPHRELIVHADSQEDRSLWLASLGSVTDGGTQSITESSLSFSLSTVSVSEFGRRCSCNARGSDDHMPPTSPLDGCCRRCMASFISKTEDALLDVTREVQLILASPYSPEGSTTAAFLKEHTGKPITNAALRQFMSGLSDYMVANRLNELRVLGGRPGGTSSVDSSGSDDDTTPSEGPNDDDAADFTERILAIINEQIEERVFFPLYRTVVDNIREQTRTESRVLRGKIEVLRSKAQSFYGIGPDSLSTSGWQTACAMLKEVDTVSLPYMKRNQLLAACKEIYAVFHLEHPDKPPMNADELIPAFIYVLVQSQLSDPVVVKEMVTFFDMGTTQGEAAYFVTCLEIAIEYIRSLLTACTVVLDATKLLGIEFARDIAREVIVVNNLIPGGQAEQSGAVHLDDVLVAVNGVLVYEMHMDEVTKMIKGIEGDVELCFLSIVEYEKRYGAMKRFFSDDGRSDSQMELIGSSLTE